MIPSISMVRTDPPTGYLEKIKANSRLDHCQLTDPQIGRRIILVHLVQIGKTKGSLTINLRAYQCLKVAEGVACEPMVALLPRQFSSPVKFI